MTRRRLNVDPVTVLDESAASTKAVIEELVNLGSTNPWADWASLGVYLDHTVARAVAITVYDNAFEIIHDGFLVTKRQTTLDEVEAWLTKRGWRKGNQQTFRSTLSRISLHAHIGQPILMLLDERLRESHRGYPILENPTGNISHWYKMPEDGMIPGGCRIPIEKVR